MPALLTGGLGGPVPAPGTAPTVTALSPTPGTVIQPTTPLAFNVSDAEANLGRVVLLVKLSNVSTTIHEVAHDGTNFGPMYQGAGNTRTVISGGYHYTLVRDGGWPMNPTLEVIARDTYGRENS